MNNEEKILEMLSTMQVQMNSMQGQMNTMQGKMDTMQKQIAAIDRRLNSVEDKLDDLIEEHSMTREGVNKLLGWADAVGPLVRYPLDKAR